MAEIMEEKKELTPAETAAPASPETPAKKPEKSTADKKKRRRTIRRIVALVVVAALIAGGVKFFKKKDGSSEVGRAVWSTICLRSWNCPPRWYFLRCPMAPSAPWWMAAAW